MNQVDGAPPASPVRSLDEAALLRRLVDGVASETGEAFFSGLVKNLASVLGVEGAWVTEWMPDTRRLRALAFWVHGQFVKEYEYAIVGTPCEPVIERTTLVHVPDNVISLYPDDPDLVRLGAMSYMGLPLLEADGRILGHLAILDTKALPPDSRIEGLFRLFADRATAELRRLRAELALRRREATLARVVNAAMDAILDVDDRFTIRHANTAAGKTFRSGLDAILGAPLARFLDPASERKLRDLATTLLARAPGDRSVWVAGGLAARDAEGEPFAAEATLSHSETPEGDACYTLVLRNVNERLAAEERIHQLSAEAAYLREELESTRGFSDLIGRSRAMVRLRSQIDEVAGTDATVLLSGETGTGKELVARAIHAASGRRLGALITVNCAAIPEALIESELFGHEAGAFTGATRRREGRFGLADGGTIFLDEVGELPLGMQAKLLRVLQEGEFEAVGSSRTRMVDVRVLAATNRNLAREVEEGRFRQDLYYRLEVFPITVPPLRERGDDVRLLAQTFAERYAARLRRHLAPLPDECHRRLKAYTWPGNVRELQNVMERAVITARDGFVNLNHVLPVAAPSRAERPGVAEAHEEILTAADLQALERRNLLRALEATKWKISSKDGAAHRLGMNPSTLRSRMKALRLSRSSD